MNPPNFEIFGFSGNRDLQILGDNLSFGRSSFCIKPPNFWIYSNARTVFRLQLIKSDLHRVLPNLCIISLSSVTTHSYHRTYLFASDEGKWKVRCRFQQNGQRYTAQVISSDATFLRQIENQPIVIIVVNVNNSDGWKSSLAMLSSAKRIKKVPKRRYAIKSMFSRTWGVDAMRTWSRRFFSGIFKETL